MPRGAVSEAVPGFLTQPTRHLFFTGKGGVGKTSLSTATALTLADAGQKVLLVSTDAASNLDEMLGVELHNSLTPVSQAAALQDDLRRASVEPYAWVLNKTVLAAGTRDPLLAARLAGERKQIERMSAGLARRLFTLPWLTVPPIGFVELSKLVGKTIDAAQAQN